MRVGKSDIRPSTSPGRKPSTGMLWRMSSIGNSRRSAARDFAAAQPKPSAKTYEMASAITPRASEYSVYFGSALGRRSICTTCRSGASNSRANATTAAIAPPSRQRIATSASPSRRIAGGVRAGGRRSGFMTV